MSKAIRVTQLFQDETTHSKLKIACDETSIAISRSLEVITQNLTSDELKTLLTGQGLSVALSDFSLVEQKIFAHIDSQLLVVIAPLISRIEKQVALSNEYLLQTERIVKDAVVSVFEDLTK